MQKVIQEISKNRPAFHFGSFSPSERIVKFRTFALLPNGGRVLLAETSTREDAVAFTRLIDPRSRITAEVLRV